MAGLLGGLTVVDLSTTQAGAPVGQLLADFGADVVMVEPPGGSPLRQIPGFPFWARGKRSTELDLSTTAGQDGLRRLLATADVLIETFRPGVLERWGLGAETLAAANPRLVHTSITAFGSEGPLANLKGYEALVMAKIGALTPFADMISRPGPAFVSVPYCSFSASQTALHGTLAALFERESSGCGQRVETSLAQAFAAHDTWNWYINVITEKYPDAFISGPAYNNGIPSSGFYFRLAVLLTKDGRWLQFSQTFPRLFRAFMRTLDLEWMYDDPKWGAVPDFPEESQRVELWDKMIDAARSKTVAEWDAVFEAERDVWGELFRHGIELLDHSQLIHDQQVVTIDDTERGAVRQPGPLVRLDRTPADIGRGAPPLGEFGSPRTAPTDTASVSAAAGESKRLPLEGVTILEFATMYAAPYASTLLSDLGAKVIKVEPLEGDLIRHVLPFPELAGMKVMQGKESIAVDLGTEEGQKIVQQFAKKADLVVQSYRSGVAKRLGVDDQTLLALNPDLIYLNAPGYGVDGPAGHRPAFAPTIGAAAGLAMRNAGGSVAERPDLSNAEVKKHSINLFRSNAPVSAQADGFSALAAATALLLGLLGRARGSGGQSMLTTMLSSVSHALGDDMVDYAGRPPTAKADPELLGLNALYRLYETSDGWVFLAAPAEGDWAPLAHELDLAVDPRFETFEGREINDAALSTVLSAAFKLHSAVEWEGRLTKHDVGCVAVDERGPELVLMGELGRASGYVADVEHPVYGEHPRLSPLVRFSRSATVAKPSCVTGDCTDELLGEIGFTPKQISDLRARQIVG